jgi:hypothetical protein
MKLCVSKTITLCCHEKTMAVDAYSTMAYISSQASILCNWE